MVKYADGNEVATEDPAKNGTVWAYNGLGQVTQSTQGQLIGGSSPWAFANLAPTGQMRSFEVYVHLTSAPGNNWQGEYHASDSGGSPTLTPVSGATPSAGGWYDLGAVALAYNDNSTTVRLDARQRIEPGRGMPRLQRPFLLQHGGPASRTGQPQWPRHDLPI